MISSRLYVLSLALGLLLPFIGTAASAQDFEAEYEGLIGAFAPSLDDTAAVAALVDRADALHDRIRQYRREKRDDLAKEERDRLRDLAREVRYFKAVTRVVGQVHNAASVSIEAFDAVNERLGLVPHVVQTFDSGLELVRIDVGGFGSLLLRNPTGTTFALTYRVNDAERPGGVGSATCESYSVMSGLFNTRDREVEGLAFTINARAVRVDRCD